MAEVGKEKREKEGKDLWLVDRFFGLYKQPNKTQILDLEDFRNFWLFGLGLPLGKS
jgi:hypothetical protein